jgi:hypothetical protein
MQADGACAFTAHLDATPQWNVFHGFSEEGVAMLFRIGMRKGVGEVGRDRGVVDVLHQCGQVIDAAQVHWLAHDTARTQGCVDQGLVLGWSGDEVPADSTLATYWAHTSSIGSKRLWERYKAMLMPELKAELETMFRDDQDIRLALDWEKADSPDSLVRRSVWIPVEAQDERHYARVVDIIAEHGVPNVHQVGLTGKKMIFFAFIHAGRTKRITPWVGMLRASVEKGESPATWYANVIDRVIVETTKVTMFSTTGYVDRSDGGTYFTSVLPDMVDLVREAAGLPRMGRNQW